MHPLVSIHPTAVVDLPCEIGAGTRIWHFCHLMAGCRIGENCVFGQNVSVGPGVVIGNGVRIQNNVSLVEGVLLEDDVFVGPGAVFTNVLRPRAFLRKNTDAGRRTTRVERGATIGANATIVCGVRLGPFALVGAGSVVTRDVPAHTLVVGNPARPRGLVCRCGASLVGDRCPACGGKI